MQKKANHIFCEADIFDIEYVVCHVGLLWRRLVNAKIKSLGVSGTEKRVLFCVARHPNLTQVQIAKILDLEPQNLIRTLDKLEQQGWIEKLADPEDRRVKCIVATISAKKIIKQINEISESVKPEILKGIDSTKIKAVVNNLASMRENLIQQLEQVEKE